MFGKLVGRRVHKGHNWAYRRTFGFVHLWQFLLVYLGEPTPLFLCYATDEGSCIVAETFCFPNHPWLVNSDRIISHPVPILFIFCVLMYRCLLVQFVILYVLIS